MALATHSKRLSKRICENAVKQEILETSINVLGHSPTGECGETAERIPGLGKHEDVEVNEERVSDIGELCRSLLATHSGSRPTRLELDMAWFLVSHCGENQDTVLHATCVAAVNWDCHALWDKAVKAYLHRGPVTWLQSQWVLDGIRKFGLQNIRSTLHEILQREDFVRPLVALFDGLKTLINSGPSEEFYRETRLWISDTQRHLWQTIGRLAQTQLDRLIHQSLMNGGLPFLRDNIVPVCASVYSGLLLIDLARRVLSDDVFRSCSLESKRITTFRCLHAAIPQLNLGKDTDLALTRESEDALRALISTALDCGIANEVLLRLLEHIDTRWKTTIQCSIDLKVFVLVLLTGVPDISLVPIRSWYASAYSQALGGVSTSAGAQCISIELCGKVLGYLADLPEGLISLFTSFRTRVEILSYCEVSPLLKVAGANLGRVAESTTLAETHKLLLRRYVEIYKFDRGDSMHLATTCLLGHKSPDGLEHLANRISCLGNEYTPTCKTIHFWERDGQLEMQTVNGKALLKSHLVKIRKMAAECELLDSCGNAFCLLIMGWMQIDVRQPTSHSIPPRCRIWVSPCACRVCGALEAFLRDPFDMAIQFEGLSVPHRDHLVWQMEDSGLGGDVRAPQIRFTYCHPDRIKIIKLPTIFQPVRNNAFRRDMRELFNIITTNPQERARILGPLYADIVAWLEGTGPRK